MGGSNHEGADGSATSLRLLVVTEVRLLREGLAVALAAAPGVASVETSRALDVRGQLAASQPDLLLADAGLVRATDIVAVAAEAGARVVAFAVSDQDDDDVLACAEAGVAGLVERNATIEELIAAVTAAARGEARCSPRVTSLMIRRIARLAAARTLDLDERPLTRREREIAILLERGLANKEIALQLGIETATVKNHVHTVLKKLGARSRGEAAARLRRAPSDPAPFPSLLHQAG